MKKIFKLVALISTYLILNATSFAQSSCASCNDNNNCTDDICKVDTILPTPQYPHGQSIITCSYIFICNAWYRDSDRDRYYSETTFSTTSRGSGWSTSQGLGGGDCDDSNPAIHPGATEICGNGIDDNCDGVMARINNGQRTNLNGDETCKEVELLGLEVTQVIQDWNNSIPLIEHKQTFVLAFIMSKDDQPKEVNVRLHVRDINGNLLGSIPAINGGDFIAQPKGTYDRIKTLRSLGKSSLIFKLDDPWTVGTITVQLEDGVDCKEIAGIPNDCAVNAQFFSSRLMNIKFYNTEWTDLNLNTYSIPDDFFKQIVHRLGSNILAQFPVSKILKTSEKYQYPYGAFGSDIFFPTVTFPQNNFYFRILKTLNGSNEDEIYLSIMNGPKPSSVGIAGLASWIPGEIATVSKYFLEDATNHELGHVLGRTHVEYCGAETSFPQGFPDDHIITNPDNTRSPSISPLPVDPQEEINRLIYPRRANDIPGDPYNTFELMSYCHPQWISDFTYNALNMAINSGTRFPLSPRNISNRTISPNNNRIENTSLPSAPYQLFAGIIDMDKQQVLLTPSVYMHATNTELPNVGEYKLQLIGEQNDLIKTVDFAPTVMSKEDETAPNMASFIIPLSLSQPLKKAVVLKNNIVISEKVAGINIPTVKVLYPNGGENLNNQTATIKWQGNDADEDILTYSIQFSKDGGNNWKTLAINLENNFYEANLNYIEGTNNGMIRVLVSDGLNVSKDESDNSFSTPNNEPNAYIISPSDAAIVIGEEPVFFRGNSFDKENGDLTASFLTWTSSLDGFLGNGETFYKSANELSEGVHVITFTATDEDGSSTSKTVKIRILRSYVFSLNCPSDITENTALGKCEANVEFAVQTRSKTDATVVYKIGGTIIASPYNFPVGTTNVLVTAANGVDPDLTCSFIVTVKDDEKPNLRCPNIPVFCHNSSGSYTIPPLQASDNCGIQSYAYTITGATIRSGNSADASGSLDPGATILEWTVTDVNGNVNNCQQTIIVNPPIIVSIPDAKAMEQGVAQNTVYIGYNPASAINIKAEASGGTGNLSYKWSTGEITPSITVSPSVTTGYTVTITDQSGCTNTATKQINVVDVRCGNNNDKVLVCHDANGKGNTICISSDAVATHLSEHGDYLGTCAIPVTTSVNKASKVKEVIAQSVKANLFPNPANQLVNLEPSNELAYGKISIQLIDRNGRLVKKSEQQNRIKGQLITLNTAGLTNGLYLVVIKDRNGNQVRHKVIIQH